MLRTFQPSTADSCRYVHVLMTAEPIARRAYQLFNQRRFSEAEQLLDLQVVFHCLATRQRLVGSGAYRTLAATWLKVFPDARLEIRSVRVIDPYLVDVDLVARGTHTGDLVLGDALTIPATGQPGQFPFRERIMVRHGRIVRIERDFDAHRPGLNCLSSRR